MSRPRGGTAPRIARPAEDAAAVARGFVDQPGFVEQFVAIKHLFFVPADAFETETEAHAVAAAVP